MIPIKKEPQEMYDNTHVYEKCVFCKQATNTWHEKTNNPVCESCAQKHKVSELKNWFKNGAVNKQKKTIKDRQKFLDVYSEFDDWLKTLGFRSGHYWKESASHLDINYWKDIDSLRSVEHYINDALQLSLRFLRYRNEHSFHIISGFMLLGVKMNLEEMKEHILATCKEIKNKKLKELDSINC